jgi:hypothetical protein
MRSQVKTFNFLPFEYAQHDLSLDLHEVRLDGESIAEIAPRRQLVSLDEYKEEEWDVVEISGTVMLPEEVLHTVLPDAEFENAPLRLMLVYRCADTFTRRAKILFDERGPVEDLAGDYPFDLLLEQEDYRGKISVEPFLVRTASGQTRAGRLSQTAYERLADGREWEVRLDRSSGPPGECLDVRFEDFSSKDIYPDDEETLYFLQCEGPNPVLWLNQGHQTVAGVLKAKGTVGGSARMRDVFFDQMTISVWSQLFAQAIVDLDEDGESQYDWQTAALGHVGDLIRPDLNYEELVEQLYAEVQSQSEFARLLREVDVALQCDTELSSHMRKLVDEVQGN